MKQFLVYKSSAGSGKTFNLVKEYLLLALKEPSESDLRPFSRIMAVTFTNKAAAEMKERVIKTLRAIQVDDKGQSTVTMRALLCDGLKISEEELKARSERVLTDLLHHYSDFSISTIDSFVHRIVRTFANDLHLPMNFSIETDEEQYLKESINRLLDDFGQDKVLTNFILEFSDYSADQGKKWNPEQNIFEYLKTFLNEKNEHARKKVEHLSLDDFNRIRSSLSKVVQNNNLKYKSLGEEALSLIYSVGLSEHDFSNGIAGVAGLFVRCKNLNFKNFKISDRYLGALNEDKWFKKGAKEEEIKFKPIKEKVRSLLNEIIIFAQNFESHQFIEKVQSNLYALALLNSVQQLLQELKTEKNFIFIKEFNQKIAQIVFHEPVPFLYERLGERYKNFLVDEFQDTNHLQWNNLLPLVDNALSEGERCLVVGDAKQSIYRWRGAEVEQFILLPKLKESNVNPVLKHREENLVRNFKENILNSNFRSKTEVVEFNNEFFLELSNRYISEENKPVYNALHQDSDKNNTGGFIIIDYFLEKIKKDKDSKDKTSGSNSEEQDANSDSEEYNSEEETDLDTEISVRVLDGIKSAIEQGFRYADVAILVRKNKVGSQMASFLESKNIPVVSTDSLLLNESAEVVLILRALKILLQPDDQIAAVSFLKQLAHVNNNSNIELTNWLLNYSSAPGLNTLQSITQSLFPDFDFYYLGKNSLWDQCSAIIRNLKLMQQNAVYCAFFLEEVQSFLQTSQTDLFSFLQHFEERKTKASVIMPPDLDAVRVMTIHASKGLEFPVVIVPELNWTKNERDQVWLDLEEKDFDELSGIMLPANNKIVPKQYKSVFQKEKNLIELDDLNLIYVAFTRAVQRLHIVAKQNSRSNVSAWLEAFISMKQQIHLGWNQITFGKAVKIISKFKDIESNKVEAPELTLWYDRMKIKLDGNLSWEAEKLNPREKGNIIHEVLSVSQNLDFALKNLNTYLDSGRINEAEKEELSKHLVEIFNHSDFNFLFDNSFIVYNERELLGTNGEVFRPDRIMMKGDEFILVDFKTGEKRKSHETQMKNYIQILKETGVKQLKSFLIYTDSLQSVEI